MYVYMHHLQRLLQSVCPAMARLPDLDGESKNKLLFQQFLAIYPLRPIPALTASNMQYDYTAVLSWCSRWILSSCDPIQTLERKRLPEGTYSVAAAGGCSLRGCKAARALRTDSGSREQVFRTNRCSRYGFALMYIIPGTTNMAYALFRQIWFRPPSIIQLCKHACSISRGPARRTRHTLFMLPESAVASSIIIIIID